MTFNWKLILFAAMTMLLAIAIVLASHYRSKLTKTQASLTEVNRELKLAKDDLDDMNRRQRDVAVLDAKYTQELADAQSTINQLERDVATGKRRLQLNATCTANGAASAGGLGNASTARLTDSAQRDYFTLRDGIETVTKQVNYLQDYIKQQCLK
ncbi:lysis protein [Cronobacter dublinensis]